MRSDRAVCTVHEVVCEGVGLQHLLKLCVLCVAESRVVVLPAILRHLCYHISNRDDLIEKSLDALGSIVSILHDQESVSDYVCMYAGFCPGFLSWRES